MTLSDPTEELAARLAKASYEVAGTTMFTAETWKQIAEHVLATQSDMPVRTYEDGTDRFVKP